jgi:hypothetical protein
MLGTEHPLLMIALDPDSGGLRGCIVHLLTELIDRVVLALEAGDRVLREPGEAGRVDHVPEADNVPRRDAGDLC